MAALEQADGRLRSSTPPHERLTWKLILFADYLCAKPSDMAVSFDWRNSSLRVCKGHAWKMRPMIKCLRMLGNCFSSLPSCPPGRSRVCGAATLSRTSFSLSFSEPGEPLHVLQQSEQSVREAKGNEVLLRVLAAPINPR
jgi:hypothetical protein